MRGYPASSASNSPLWRGRGGVEASPAHWKAAMLRQVHDSHPEATVIGTNNAEVNAPNPLDQCARRLQGRLAQRGLSSDASGAGCLGGSGRPVGSPSSQTGRTSFKLKVTSVFWHLVSEEAGMDYADGYVERAVARSKPSSNALGGCRMPRLARRWR
jgi:hypothetical protein